MLFVKKRRRGTTVTDLHSLKTTRRQCGTCDLSFRYWPCWTQADFVRSVPCTISFFSVATLEHGGRHRRWKFTTLHGFTSFKNSENKALIGINCPLMSWHYFSIALPSELLRKRTEKFLRKLNAFVTNCYLTVQLFIFILFITFAAAQRERRRYCVARRHAVYVCSPSRLYHLSTERRTSLGGEGNAMRCIQCSLV